MSLRDKLTDEEWDALSAPKVQDSIVTPNYYDNSKGSLYQFAENNKLNSYEFDIIKRITRCRKKGNFEEDLKKTIVVIELYLKEQGNKL